MCNSILENSDYSINIEKFWKIRYNKKKEVARIDNRGKEVSMLNKEVLEKINVKKAKEQFHGQYDSVIKLLDSVPDDYDYYGINVSHEWNNSNLVEIRLESRTRFDLTSAIKNGKIISGLDKYDRTERATAHYYVAVSAII